MDSTYAFAKCQKQLRVVCRQSLPVSRRPAYSLEPSFAVDTSLTAVAEEQSSCKSSQAPLLARRVVEFCESGVGVVVLYVKHALVARASCSDKNLRFKAY